MRENRNEWGQSCIDEVEYSLSKIRLRRCTQDMQDGYLVDQRMDRISRGAQDNGYAIPEKRVILFQSTDTQIIRTLLLRSRRLRQMIAMLPGFGARVGEDGEIDCAAQAARRSELLELEKEHPEDLYNFFYHPNSMEIRLQRNFSEVFETRHEITAQMEQAYRCTPCYQLLNFQDFDERKQKEMLRLFLESDCFRDSVLLIVSPQMPDLTGYGDAVAVIHVALPRIQDIMDCLRRRAMKRRRMARSAKPLPPDFESALRAEAGSLLGLRFAQIEDVIYAMEQDAGFCCEAEAASIRARKACREIRGDRIEALRREMADEDTTLTVVDCSGDVHIACPPGYCQWLDIGIRSFRDALYAKRSGERCVKGVLMAGPPGTGKTLMARYTAKRLGVPLVQLKMESIKNMWQGESQARLKTFLRRVEELKPCVLFIDEIDKVLQKNSSDNKTDTEMRGQLLGWMQSHEGAVFCFFTANDVSDLPNELIRNDRLSARMFAFMPSAQALADILHVQLREISDGSLQANGEEDKAGILLSEDFRRKLRKTEEIRSDLTALIDSITPEDGDTLESWKDSPLLFTGADMKELLDKTVKYLNYSETFRRETGRSGSRREYTFEEFKKAFLQRAKREQPEGRSNFADVAACWMKLREKDYADVMELDEDLPIPEGAAQSAEPVIPFRLYNTSYALPEKDEEKTVLSRSRSAGAKGSGKPLFVLDRLGDKGKWRGGKPPKAGEAHHYDYYMYQLVTLRVQEIVEERLRMEAMMNRR